MKIKSKLQFARKVVQFIFLMPLFVVPILNLYQFYFIKGTYISLDMGSLSISDPVAVLQALFLSQSVRPVMLASLAIPILIVLFFGRVWCSWACPYHLLLDGFDALRKKLKMKPLKPIDYSVKRIHNANIIRYALLLFGFIIVGIFGIPILYMFSPPSVMSSQAVLILKYGYITAEFLLFPVLVIIDYFFAYRLWCRYVCPTGSCLSLFQNRLAMHVAHSGECSNCNTCVHTCPMGLDPRKDGLSSQCDNCGKCISACPDNKKTETLFFKIK